MENDNYTLQATVAKKLGIDPTPIIGGLQDHHVICGRGTGGNRRKANEKYRRLVETFWPRYLTASDEEKRGIAWETLHAVANQGMEIVKKYENTGKWHRVTSKKACVKTQQYLRDGRPQDQRKKVTKKNTKKSTTTKRAPKVKESYAPMKKRPLIIAVKSSEMLMTEPIPLEDAHKYCSVDLSLLSSLFHSCDSKASLSATGDEAAPQDCDWQTVVDIIRQQYATSIRPSDADLISSDCVDSAVLQHMIKLSPSSAVGALDETKTPLISNYDDLDPADDLLLELTAKLER